MTGEPKQTLADLRRDHRYEMTRGQSLRERARHLRLRAESARAESRLILETIAAR